MKHNTITDSKGLLFFNGYGGFSKDGKEYHILTNETTVPPMPWINVIANAQFGFQVSESGAGFTWAINSRENKITPWSNDPVMDRVSEAIYIVDQQTKQVITPASYGRDKQPPYRVCHGFGYSRFEHQNQDLGVMTTVFVAKDEPIKLWQIDLNNQSKETKHLQIDYFVEWTLGVDRYQSNAYLTSDYEREQQYIFAQNVYAHAYQKNPAFIFASEELVGYSGDKMAYIGLDSSVKQPKGLYHPLPNQVGSFDENAGIIRFNVTLEPNATKRVVLGLGQASEHEKIKQLVAHYKQVVHSQTALEEVTADWRLQLEQIQIATSNPALDLMINGWLLYQTIACRMYARAAFYQCGGAYGYRDQLQDAMALVHNKPSSVRQQIILAASRQFEEGDVQHWWHPPTGVGVRTKMSDDLLWLPFVMADYIKVSGDASILDEVVSYITAPLLTSEQHEVMYTPEISQKVDSLYEHAKLTIVKTKMGEHGLPLMGGGDWNDGMNLVGIEGRGESIWLGWFLYRVMDDFIPLALLKKDDVFAAYLEKQKLMLQANLEKHGWDGKWYMRAYYDDGSKMGSKESDECQIDSISQSWSILSKAASPERGQKAFQSAWRHLVLKKEKISLLLHPPFDKTLHNPGYIKNYYPGIRENGGQYTHAAVWLAMAATQIKDYNRAAILFDNLLPINHTLNQKAADHYEKEPYVLPGDVSYEAPYTGRGGWSWYSGSAGWLYQGVLQSFLGLYKEKDTLIIDPATAKEFGDYTIYYRFGTTIYTIKVFQKQDQIKKSKLVVDDIEQSGNRFLLVDDQKEHSVIYFI